VGILLLVRHGQASFGAADYDRLSDLGHEQARTLGAALADLAPDGLTHGSLRRQVGTAASMAEAAGWDVTPALEPGWDEFDHLAVLAAYGEDPAGLDRRAFQELFERATAHWQQSSPAWPAFLERTRAALEAVAARGGTQVVVTSGGVIGALGAALLGVPAEAVPALWQRLNAVVVNTSVTRVIVGSTGTRLLTFNEHEHLAREQVTYR
jgi:broad specificity phosphatase PhoE